MDHSFFAQKVIELAKKNVRSGRGGPFAAIIVNPKTGEVVSEATNSVLETVDPTAHAEINAIRKATQKVKHFELRDFILYTSCEPCPMCLGAIYWARLSKVIYCADRADAARAGFDDSFIYDEIPVQPHLRKIPMIQERAPNRQEPFQDWIQFENKIPY